MKQNQQGFPDIYKSSSEQTIIKFFSKVYPRTIVIQTNQKRQFDWYLKQKQLNSVNGSKNIYEWKMSLVSDFFEWIKAY